MSAELHQHDTRHSNGCVHPACSVTAVQIVADMLANPYPHDLMAIRREVEREWGDEEVAREEMDAYCTHEAMMEARRKWTASQDAAREWLSSQNAKGDSQSPAKTP